MKKTSHQEHPSIHLSVNHYQKLNYFSDFNALQYRNYKNVSAGINFVKLHYAIITLQFQPPTLHISSLTSVQSGIEDVHVMPFSDLKFHENWCRERHTSFKGINTTLPVLSSLPV
jgi:hypothetical protein